MLLLGLTLQVKGQSDCSGTGCAPNILQYGDFESFSNNVAMNDALTSFFGPIPFYITDMFNNSPDLIPPGGIPTNNNCADVGINWGNDNGLHLAIHKTSGGVKSEGVALPLCPGQQIGDGTSAIVLFDAVIPAGCAVFEPQISLEFTEVQPVVGQSVYANPGTVGGPWLIPITNTANPGSTAVYQQYAQVVTNNSGGNFSHLIFSSFTDQIMGDLNDRGSIFIDNILIYQNTPLVATSVADEYALCSGETVEITYNICNNSNIPQLLPFDIDITLPTGLTLVPNADFPSTSVTIAPETLAPNGGCIQLTLLAEVSATAPDGPAIVLLDIVGGACLNASQSTSLFLVSDPLSITKQVSNPTPFDGETITYTITVTNNTMFTLDHVLVSDILPAGLINPSSSQFTISGNTLTANLTLQPSTIILTFTAVVDYATGGDLIENCITATFDGTECPVEACISIKNPVIGYDCPCTSGNYFNIGSTTDPDGITYLDESGLPPTSETNPLTNACIAVYGELVIGTSNGNAASLITGNCEFRMQPGSKIRIYNNSTLRDEFSLFNGCVKMWNGIFVNTKGTLDLRNSIIEDAEFPVNMSKKGVLSSVGTTYRYNYAGLRFQPAAATNFVLVNFSNNTFHCDGCSAANPILPPPQNTVIDLTNPTPVWGTYSGILMDKHTNFELTGGNNVFRNIANGIRAINSNMTVTGCRFEGINQASSGGYAFNRWGFGIWATGMLHTLTQVGYGEAPNSIPSFSDCTTGIDVTGMNADISDNLMTGIGTMGIVYSGEPTCDASIRFNRIASSYRGIFIRGTESAGQVDCSYNTIDITTTPTTPSLPNAYGISIADIVQGSGLPERKLDWNVVNIHQRGTGIKLTTLKGIGIHENMVHLMSSSPVESGISISSLDNSVFGCNDVDGTTTTGANNMLNVGISAFGITNSSMACNTVFNTHIGVQFAGLNTATEFKATRFGPAAIGLHMTASAAFGDYVNGGQLFDQVHRGNVWVEPGTFTFSGAVHEGADPQLLYSKFITHTNQVPLSESYYPPNVMPTGNIWFDGSNMPTGSPYLCNDIVDCGGEGQQQSGISSLEKALINDEVELSAFDEGVKWENKRKVWRKIDDNPAVAGNDAELISFYNTHTTTAVGRLSKLDVDKESMQIIVPESLALIEQKKSASELLSAQINAQLSLIDMNDDAAVIQAALDNLEPLYDALEINATETDQIVNDFVAERISKADVADNVNSAIPVNKVYEENEKIVNNVYLDMLKSHTEAPNAEQINALSFVANQCPLSGGSAVFRARILLDPFVTTAYDDATICATAGVIYLTVADVEKRFLEAGASYSLDKSKNKAGEDAGKVQEISLFPNPADEQLTITGGQGIDFISLSDCVGRIIGNYRAGGQASYVIDTHIYPDGVYYLKIALINGQSKMFKLNILH